MSFNKSAAIAVIALMVAAPVASAQTSNQGGSGGSGTTLAGGQKTQESVEGRSMANGGMMKSRTPTAPSRSTVTGGNPGGSANKN